MIVKIVCFIFGHDIIPYYNQKGLVPHYFCLRCTTKFDSDFAQ